MPYSLIPMLLFFGRFDRRRTIKSGSMNRGLWTSRFRRFELEMPFFLVTARLGGES